MFNCTTEKITIEVEPAYIPEQSDPKQSLYFFSYSVRIHNNGDSEVQLLRRHWIITDGLGRVEEVEGSGVVGEQPVLQPGSMFEYSSFCPLHTPTGSMQGEYTMRSASGGELLVKIPYFILAEPTHYH